MALRLFTFLRLSCALMATSTCLTRAAQSSTMKAQIGQNLAQIGVSAWPRLGRLRSRAATELLDEQRPDPAKTSVREQRNRVAALRLGRKAIDD